MHKGMAELVDVEGDVLRAFSRRRQDIERAAAEEGGLPLTSIARGKAMALATRGRKTYGIETHTWREEIQARASELGLDQAALDELTARWANRDAAARPPAAVDNAALGDRLASVGGLTSAPTRSLSATCW